MNDSWFFFLTLIPCFRADNMCVHLARISTLNDLATLDFRKHPVILMDHTQFSDQYKRALQVYCIYGTVFESSEVKLNAFLGDFQSLRISSKLHVKIHTNINKERIHLLNNIHRSFNIILESQIYPPYPLGLARISITLFNLWPHYFSSPSGLRGTDRSLIQILAKKLGFSYDFMPPALSINARTLSNGTIVGIIPDVS